MRKLVALLALVFAFGLVGCGSSAFNEGTQAYSGPVYFDAAGLLGASVDDVHKIYGMPHEKEVITRQGDVRSRWREEYVITVNEDIALLYIFVLDDIVTSVALTFANWTAAEMLPELGDASGNYIRYSNKDFSDIPPMFGVVLPDGARYNIRKSDIMAQITEIRNAQFSGIVIEVDGKHVSAFTVSYEDAQF